MKLLVLSDFIPKVKIGNKLQKLMMESDYILFNLEGSPNFENGKSFGNQILPFKYNELVNFLKEFGKEKFVVSLANNHVLDNGELQFNELVKRLKVEDIKYVGTKDKPYIIIGEFAILSFVSWETGINFKARKNLNTLFFSYKNIYSIVEFLSKKAKFVIIYPHWGMDLYNKVTKNHINFIKSIIKRDVMIFGHHPHIFVKGFEQFGNKFIFSLGNTFIPHPNYYKRFDNYLKISKVVLLEEDDINLLTLFYDGSQLDIIEEHFDNNSNFENFPEIRRFVLRPVANFNFLNFFVLIYLKLLELIIKILKKFKDVCFSK